MKISGLSRPARPLLVAGVGIVILVVGIGGAIANSTGNSTQLPITDSNGSSSGIAGKSWAELGAEQFETLPPGTRIVDCSPSQKQLPPGAIPSQAPDFAQMNPGFHYLIDGRCAFDPRTAWWSPIAKVKFANLPAGTQIMNCWEKIERLPKGVRIEVGPNFSKTHAGFYFLIDGRCALGPNQTSAEVSESRTKAFDLRWFGTGTDGGPGAGAASCFGGNDPLEIHCGIPTNLTSRRDPFKTVKSPSSMLGRPR